MYRIDDGTCRKAEPEEADEPLGVLGQAVSLSLGRPRPLGRSHGYRPSCSHGRLARMLDVTAANENAPVL
jgi:hypothetical protein